MFSITGIVFFTVKIFFLYTVTMLMTNGEILHHVLSLETSHLKSVLILKKSTYTKTDRNTNAKFNQRPFTMLILFSSC